MLRRTYNAKWREPSYRERSPAVDAKENILRELRSFMPDLCSDAGKVRKPSIADIGCGTGRFLPILSKSGYCPIGIDIAENCFDPAICKDFTLIVCPITDLDDSFSVDACVCSDMMEHIPTELIDPVLAKIAQISKYGAVFGISNLEDDGKLHCSLQSRAWWEDKLSQHFPKVVACEHSVRHPRQNAENWFLFRCGK